MEDQPSASLTPPFVLREEGDSDLVFFSNLDDIFSDRFDCLWAEFYDAWDSSGRRFRLRRVVEPKSLFDRVTGSVRERLVLVEVGPHEDVQALRERLLHWAQGVLRVPLPPETPHQDLTFQQLLAICTAAEEARLQ